MSEPIYLEESGAAIMYINGRFGGVMATKEEALASAKTLRETFADIEIEVFGSDEIKIIFDLGSLAGLDAFTLLCGKTKARLQETGK